MIKGNNNSGFTLLELLGVMGVIVIMSFVVVGSFRSIRQGLNDVSSSKTLYDSVVLARQHAMLDNSRVFLIVTGINKYILCREGGTITHREKNTSKNVSYIDKEVSAFWVSDEWADWSSMSETFTSIYDEDQIKDLIGSNLKQSKYEGVSVYDFYEGEYVIIAVPPFQDSNNLWVMGFNSSAIKDEMFAVGNYYGWMLYEERSLPVGFAFDKQHYKLDADGNFEYASGSMVCFNPDGAIDTSSDFVDELVFGEIDATKDESIKNTVSLKFNIDGSIVVE